MSNNSSSTEFTEEKKTYMSHELAEVGRIVGESVHENDGNIDTLGWAANFFLHLLLLTYASNTSLYNP